jgi:hypothetical protein
MHLLPSMRTSLLPSCSRFEVLKLRPFVYKSVCIQQLHSFIPHTLSRCSSRPVFSQPCWQQQHWHHQLQSKWQSVPQPCAIAGILLSLVHIRFSKTTGELPKLPPALNVPPSLRISATRSSGRQAGVGLAVPVKSNRILMSRWKV